MAIVCGTDFSPLSDGACSVAAELAGKQGTPLVLVHAVAPHLPGEDASGEVVAVARENLAQRGAAFRKLGTDVLERLEVGRPDEVLAAIAAETRAAMIVLAATTRSGTRWLLGSTADRIASTVDVPVLIVREGFPYRQWLDGSRSLRIMLATDLSPISDNAIEWASKLSALGSCTFTIAHLSWPPETYRRMGIEGPLVLDPTHPAVDMIVRRELDATAERLRTAGTSEIVVESSFRNPAETLNRIAETKAVDLLVLGHHPAPNWRVWEGSVARAVMRSAVRSVATVPDTDVPRPRSLPRVRRVIAATDLSHAGNSAVAYALSIVERGGHVTVLHVLENSDLDGDARKRIADSLSVLTILPGVTNREFTAAVELLESDERGAAICDFASRDGADLICISSGGRSRLPRVLLGSVAQEVLLLSRKPVLVVPSLP